MFILTHSLPNYTPNFSLSLSIYVGLFPPKSYFLLKSLSLTTCAIVLQQQNDSFAFASILFSKSFLYFSATPESRYTCTYILFQLHRRSGTEPIYADYLLYVFLNYKHIPVLIFCWGRREVGTIDQSLNIVLLTHLLRSIYPSDFLKRAHLIHSLCIWYILSSYPLYIHSREF